jgi:hypothetical protein
VASRKAKIMTDEEYINELKALYLKAKQSGDVSTAFLLLEKLYHRAYKQSSEKKR